MMNFKNKEELFELYVYLQEQVYRITLHVLGEFINLINVISGKYLILCFIWCIYLSYSSINDKIIFTSYSSDSYNDFILNKITNRVLQLSKFNIHFINNKMLHPITLFLQNL